MRLPPPPLLEYSDRRRHATRHHLSAAGIEPLTLAEVLALADDEMRGLWESLAFGYTSADGHPLLREEIAAWVGVATEDVLTFAGAQEALFTAFSSLVSPGDHVLMPAPAFPPLVDIPHGLGAKVTFLPMDEKERWAIDLSRLNAMLRPDTRLIVLNAPHNPTGTLSDAETFREVMDLADARGIPVLCDEAFRGLELDPAKRLPSAAALSPTAVSIGGMSKAFGLSGLRIGWMATRNHRLLARAREAKYYTSMCNSAPAEILAVIALRAHEAILARSREILTANMNILDRFLAEHSDRIGWVRPQCGSIAFPRLKSGDGHAFYELLLASEGVLAQPGDLFHGSPAHFRLGFGHRNLATQLESLGRVFRMD